MSELYDKLKENTARFGENNDCAVKTVAIVTDLSYEQSRNLLAKYGRKSGKGTFFDTTTLPAINSQGFALTDVTALARSSWGKTIKTFERRVPKGTYIIRTARHILAAKDGKVHDFTSGRRHIVKYVYRVEKVGEKLVDVQSSVPQEPIQPITPKKKRVTVPCSCPCGKVFNLTMIRVNRMKRGKKYFCPTCRGEIRIGK